MRTGLEKTSLADSLSEVLRRQIITGEVPAEQRLSEIWVANRFDVGRPTAKASLDRLVGEGILRRGRQRAAIIPRLSGEDIRDIYLSREPVESRAVWILAREQLVPPDSQRALTLMSVAAELDNHVDHVEADIALHRALVAGSGSQRLCRMHETVMGEAQLCIAQVRRRTGVDLSALTTRHAEILDRIREGDPEGALVALRRDLSSCRDSLLADIPQANGST